MRATPLDRVCVCVCEFNNSASDHRVCVCVVCSNSFCSNAVR